MLGSRWVFMGPFCRERVETALVVVHHDPEEAAMGERMVFLKHGWTARWVPKHALPSPCHPKAWGVE